MPVRADRSVRITSPRDPIRQILWGAAGILVALAAGLRAGAVLPAARATIGPFATLATIIAGAALAGHLGAFRLAARLLMPDRASRWLTAVTVLAFTALLSALVNLDVAVVVATPLALRAARRHLLPAGPLAAAVAITANAASFLLPTSNITNLLLLGRVPLPALGYLQRSWLPWLLVTVTTIGPLSAWLQRAHARGWPAPAAVQAGRSARADPAARADLSAWTLTDLIPMFLAASAIRTILAAGITLHGGFLGQLGIATAICAGVSNLPAAAALRPAGSPGLWAAILATDIGPNLLITGSVATVICRRIARDAGVGLSAWRFAALGAALLPAQLFAATLGLRIAPALLR